MALHKARKLWPERLGPADRDDARIDLIASDVVEHLELCGIRCVKKGPASPHGTLGVGRRRGRAAERMVGTPGTADRERRRCRRDEQRQHLPVIVGDA